MKPQLTEIRKFTDSLAFMNLPVFTYIERDDFAIVRVEELGMKIPHNSPVFRPDHFNIIVVPDGSATYLINDTIFEISSHQILFIRPDTFLSYRWLHVGRAYMISFSASFFLQFWASGINEIQRLDNCKGYIANLTEEMMKNVEQICQNIYKETTSQIPYKYELITNLILNLLLLIRRQQQIKQQEVPVNTSNPYVTQFFLDLENNFSTIISGETKVLLRAKDYANRQNLNENYLSKTVCTHSGKTVSQWIHEKLINEIKFLLKYTDKSMREIASLYGFHDLNYFYNYFKRHTKNAPGLFRKSFTT